MDALAITSLTNFLLAGETLLLAARLARIPKERYSAAWLWTAMLLLLGVGALLGGIDHGFFEPAHWPRYLIQRADWIVLGAMTFCLLLATAAQFFSARGQRITLIAGTIQFVVSTIFFLLIDDFRVVSFNYAPVLILLLVLSRGRFWQITAGILILIAASAIQALRVDTFSPLDHNGLYHVVSMAGVFFLYRGGLRLKPVKSLALLQ